MRTVTKIGLAAAALGTGAAYMRFRAEMASILECVTKGGRIAETSAGPIEYAESGSGFPALVIHGAGGGYDQGLLVGRTLPSGFRVIAPSRFGYLGTPLPADPSPPAQADAHVALLEELHVDRAVVVGISAGAPSAVELAVRHPARVHALVLLVPRGYAPERTGELQETFSNSAVLNVIMSGADFGYWTALHVARRSVVQFLGVPPDVEARAAPSERARVDEIMRSVLPISRRVAGIRGDSVKLQPSQLERITAPTLIVTTRDDLYATLPAAQFMADRINGARLVALDDGGHLFVGRQAEVDRVVGDFLREHAAEGVSGTPHAPPPRRFH
jgi:2-hydroxy-6-oxonona-2,4-dienedioate hydrolase